MLQRSSSGYQLEEVHASLDLLQQMLASNKVPQPFACEKRLISFRLYQMPIEMA